MIRVIGPIESDSPDDGGRWMLLCEHFDAQVGDWLVEGMLQDSNRRRLSAWRSATVNGLTSWCPVCQDAYEDAVK